MTTSNDSFDRLTPRLGRMQALVLDAMRALHAQGRTDMTRSEIGAETARRHPNVMAEHAKKRVLELVRLGHLAPVSERPCSITGERAGTFRVVFTLPVPVSANIISLTCAIVAGSEVYAGPPQIVDSYNASILEMI